MVAAEESTHSFIVKIWLEEIASETTPAHWRGHITHVISGTRCYIEDINDVLAFMRPYLQQWEHDPKGDVS